MLIATTTTTTKEEEERVPLMISSKRGKNNLTKELQVKLKLQNIAEESEKHLNKWGNIPCLCFGRIKI